VIFRLSRASLQITGRQGKLIAYACRVPKQQQPRPEPLDPPMVPIAVAGLIAWAVVGLVLLIFFRDWLTEHHHQNWLWTCLAGFLWGFPGLATMMRHDANRRRRRRRAN
jgi:hypothetical protein